MCVFPFGVPLDPQRRGSFHASPPLVPSKKTSHPRFRPFSKECLGLQRHVARQSRSQGEGRLVGCEAKEKVTPTQKARFFGAMFGKADRFSMVNTSLTT